MEIGTVVISKAGRDKGKNLVITGIDSGFVFVADGKERKLASPKRKNIKHIQETHEKIDMENITDAALRRLFHGRNTWLKMML
jgi:ribosomal protein L14E/L6E/L27E